MDFEPLEKGKVSMYVCGPTVYDIPHLGHGRSATAFDVIRRYLEYRDYNVNFVSNYTDIDDKMIARAAKDGMTVAELAAKVIPEYEKDYGRLGIKVPSVQPKATDHIDEMIELVEMLIDKEFAYELDDGWYFDVMKFEEYGKLSGQKLEELKMGARVEVKEGKRNPYDFALWKLKKEGEPSWKSDILGEGRPGWHIECSAMARKHLGGPFDIHGGGLDLTFPHHECEIAQTEGALGSDSFARYWMHNGFINIDNEKMSKSLNNFFTLQDIFEKYDPKVVRMMFLQTHYRNPINFSDVLLDQAKVALGKIHGFVERINIYTRDVVDEPVWDADFTKNIEEARLSFVSSMDDDFNTSGGLGALFTFIKQIDSRLNGVRNSAIPKKLIFDFLSEVDSVFGVIFPDEEAVEEFLDLNDLDEATRSLIEGRTEARAAENYTLADQLKSELASKGIEPEDTAEGTKWKCV